jgi:hypothetical protein
VALLMSAPLIVPPSDRARYVTTGLSDGLGSFRLIALTTKT